MKNILQKLESISIDIWNISLLPISLICVNGLFCYFKNCFISFCFNAGYHPFPILDTNTSENTRDNLEIIQEEEILDYFFLDVSNNIAVVNYINYHFIKNLIIESQKNIDLNVNNLLNNRAFFLMLKQMLDNEDIKNYMLNNLTNEIDRFSFSLFLDYFKNYNSSSEFSSVVKNKRVLKVFLNYVTSNYIL